MIPCLIAPKGSFGYSQVSGTSHLTGVVVHSLKDLVLLCTGQQAVYNDAQAEKYSSAFPQDHNPSVAPAAFLRDLPSLVHGSVKIST